MGGRPLRAVLATLLVAAGLAALSARSADAVSTGRPIAVAVAADGTSYVGFASGGRLLRLDRWGEPDGSVALDRDGPVDGLAIGPDGMIWVDYGASVSRLDPDGTLLTHFPTTPGDCPVDRAHDPARFGGLAVTATRVYVATRCESSIRAYSHAGELHAAVALPGDGSPRGIAWAPSTDGLPALVYVAVPAAGKVYAYAAGRLAPGLKPRTTLQLPRRPGYTAPVPAGIAADAKGQLAVTDAANNAVHLYNALGDYGLYRTLGHPPRPSTAKGRLDRPTAIAQGAPVLGGHYWVADTGNGRIQRWTPEGTTQWMGDAVPPGDPDGPVNVEAPVISGEPVTGAILSCSDGSWAEEPTALTHSWRRDGVPVPGATEPTYAVGAADRGAELVCVVTATGPDGSRTAAASAPLAIPGPDPDPGDPTPAVKTCRGRASVVIDGGARYTREPYVSLKIRAPRGATAVTITNDAGFKRADTRALEPGCRYLWTLPKRTTKAPKTVWVRFPGARSAGRASARIQLDSVAPVLRRATARWQDRRWGWVLSVRAADRGSGLATITYGRSRSSNQTVRWGADIVSWDRSWLRWVRVQDRAGNTSPWRRVPGG